MKKDKNNEIGEVSRRDFLVGAGAIVVGGAIGAGITYPLVSGGDGEVLTTTKTVSVPTTVTTTVGDGGEVTVTKTVTDTTGPGEPEESFIVGLGFCGNEPFAGSNAVVTDVKNGKIVRIRPLHFDWKYGPEDMNLWQYNARGKIFDPGMKTFPPLFSMAYKKRVYSPNRIRYPLKRVDWDPNGDRHTENRGKSKFKRITWEEAADIISGEINRIRDEYGPCAIAARTPPHGETKCLHYAHGPLRRVLKFHLNDYTPFGGGGPHSWIGWFWGAKHVWGMTPAVGEQAPVANCFRDIAENSEVVLFWGCDPEATPQGWDGQQSSRICYYWSECGVRSIYVCPDLNYGAAVHADKWIPVFPNTDSALHLAISYIWMTEDTYDSDYIDTHTHGFEEYEKYVMGEEDGIPKTPEWASPICGVPEWTIKALARVWASKVTSTSHGNGGCYIRGPYSHEPARLEVCNLAMQGIGKPGQHMVKMIEWNHKTGSANTNPLPRSMFIPDLSSACRGAIMGPTSQTVPIHLLPEYIETGEPVSWYYSSFPWGPTADQWVKYTYPAPDCPEVHMIWSDGACFFACESEGHRTIEAIRDPSIECYVVQHPWLETNCLYADVILPSNTKLEEEDIGSDSQNGQYAMVFLEKKCIESIGESKSDFEAAGEVAKKLGVYEQYIGGKTDEEWIRDGFDNSGIQDMISWEDFNDKGYFIIPTAPDWEDDPVGMSAFYADPDSNPLETPTGKIEFYSEGLAEHFPDDKERPPVPHYIQGGPASEGWTHDESRFGEKAKTYPLLIITNHGKWRVHAEHDDISWIREINMCKVKGPDGYLYEPLWINPADAEARGIRDGDVVRIFNDMGAILGGARVTERIKAGALSMDHGARIDPITTGLDRGGCNNLIMPIAWVSQNCLSGVFGGVLVEVEKADLDELRSQYPEAFARNYDPASGLLFNSWVEGGMD